MPRGSAHRAASPIRNVIRSDLKWMTCAIISHSVQVRSMIPPQLRTRTLHCIRASAESNLEEPTACMKDACCRRTHHGSWVCEHAICKLHLPAGQGRVIAASRGRLGTATRSSSQPATRAASWEEHGMLTARMACIQPVLSTRLIWVEKSSRDCRYVTDGVILEHACVTRIFSIVCDVHDQAPSWAEYNTDTYAHYACTMQSLSFSASYSHTATLLHSRAFLGCAPMRPSGKSKHRHANRWRHQGIQPSQADKARAHGQPLMCGVQRAENPPHVRPERAWRGMRGVRGSNVPASHPHLRNQRCTTVCSQHAETTR
jgi:hypothetical protein